jgi:hypothetical protein
VVDIYGYILDDSIRNIDSVVKNQLTCSQNRREGGSVSYGEEKHNYGDISYSRRALGFDMA